MIIGFARQIIERIAQKVNIAALPHCFGQHFLNGTSQAGMIVADHELHSVQRPLS
jgi:hypothetical protein